MKIGEYVEVTWNRPDLGGVYTSIGQLVMIDQYIIQFKNNELDVPYAVTWDSIVLIALIED